MPAQEGANLEALSDLCTPWCVHVVATLRIADHIEAGVDQIGDLAAAVRCDTYALHRVLTYLVGKGVFEETTPGRFGMNEAARGLLDPARRLGLDLEGIGGNHPATLSSSVVRPDTNSFFLCAFCGDFHGDAT
jgi:2,7-dihydroxy-5-methyl-1-naphthoate 7-O-methyltransferase